ncbi:hypothetical protein IWX48DRAFT_619192 [Phyllosticta citricarpa]
MTLQIRPTVLFSLLWTIGLIIPVAGDQRQGHLLELEVGVVNGSKIGNSVNVEDIQALMVRIEELGIRKCW